ncbi:hypothetical protein QBC47DRAFT_138372 [Echria macrotheca]|uniref:Uncharacterized protein n=1 Tax=Echria macrotheca TaxID=438768 RepID=A0AAJ0BHJ7_9PEZI|nr:hypothetical protein QBC47DRAFT_138372 [Echria macrotheca]
MSEPCVATAVKHATTASRTAAYGQATTGQASSSSLPPTCLGHGWSMDGGYLLCLCIVRAGLRLRAKQPKGVGWETDGQDGLFGSLSHFGTGCRVVTCGKGLMMCLAPWLRTSRSQGGRGPQTLSDLTFHGNPALAFCCSRCGTAWYSNQNITRAAPSVCDVDMNPPCATTPVRTRLVANRASPPCRPSALHRAASWQHIEMAIAGRGIQVELPQTAHGPHPIIFNIGPSRVRAASKSRRLTRERQRKASENERVQSCKP